MAEGYIKLYRQLASSDIWLSEPFSRGQAWVDILMSANHKDCKIIFDGNLIDVNRGSFITSIRKLCQRWRWSNTKVTRFLDVLKSSEMIAYFSDAKKTVISIEKWDFYQGGNDAETPLKRRRNAAETPLKHTDNNDKNDKKDIYTPEPPDGSSRKTPVFDAESKPYRCAVYLANKIKERVPDKKIPAQFMQTWAHEMDKLNRIDGHKWEDIAAVLDFSQQDKFWSKQILSGGNLRKHFDRLYLNMQEDETQ